MRHIVFPPSHMGWIGIVLEGGSGMLVMPAETFAGLDAKKVEDIAAEELEARYPPPAPIPVPTDEEAIAAVRTLEAEGWRFRLVVDSRGKLLGINPSHPDERNESKEARNRCRSRYSEVMRGVDAMRLAILLRKTGGWEIV